MVTQSPTYAPGSEKLHQFSNGSGLYGYQLGDLNIKLCSTSSETWKRTAMIALRLDVFHRHCLCTILGISLRDHIDKWRGDEEGRARREENDRPHSPTAEKRRAHTTMYWVSEERGGMPKKTSIGSTFKEDLEEIGVSWHRACKIDSNRDFSLPDAPRVSKTAAADINENRL